MYFSDPKDSIIDIIQAVGRSLRKDSSKPDKVSYIVIPVIIPDTISKFEDIDPAEFTTLHAVIQALRDQDRILADFIDKANLNAAKGHGGGNGGGGGDPAPLVISTPVDMSDFTDGLYLRIAEVNKDPGNIAPEFIVGTKRTSGVTRMFRTVGDYNIEAYYKNLVLPTLKKYPDLTTGLSRTDIAIDHNNVSHCVKIGALEERNKKFYITDIGKALIEYEDLYVDIFKEQMLKYYEPDAITKVPRFPYRMAFRVFAEVGYLTQFELAYSLYIVRGIGEAGENEAIERVKFLRETYPNIEILNQTNKELVLNILNTKYNTTLTFADIWTSRTTVYNQFNYIKKHLFAFSDIFDNNSAKNVIRLLPGGKEKILDLLLKTKEITTCPMDTLKKYFMQYKGY